MQLCHVIWNGQWANDDKTSCYYLLDNWRIKSEGSENISRSLKPVLFFAAATAFKTHPLLPSVAAERNNTLMTNKPCMIECPDPATAIPKLRKDSWSKLLNVGGWIYQLEGINADSSHSTYTQACQYLPRICLKRKLPLRIDLHLPLFVLYIACPPRSRIRLSFPRNTARNLLQQFLTRLHLFLKRIWSLLLACRYCQRPLTRTPNRCPRSISFR